MFDILECDQGSKCQNSITNRGEGGAKCVYCRFAPENENLHTQHWKPIRSAEIHPVVFQEKLQAKVQKRQDSLKKRLGKDKKTSKIVRKAAKAENATNKNIIKATKNSGRSFRDGDHLAANFIGLDTKLQTDRINPIVKLDELDKAITDVTINGQAQIGGLVLRNKLGAGFVVFREEDFAKHILSRLLDETIPNQE